MNKEKFIITICIILAILFAAYIVKVVLSETRFLGGTVEGTGHLRWSILTLNEFYLKNKTYPTDVNEFMQTAQHENMVLGQWYYHTNGNCFKLLWFGVFKIKPEYPKKNALLVTCKNGSETFYEMKSFLDKSQMNDLLQLYNRIDCNDPNMIVRPGDSR